MEKALDVRRPAIDLSPLNNYVTLLKFKMEMIMSILASIQNEDVMFLANLRDVYFNITIHPELKPLPRFVINEMIQQFKALCFGLSSVPQVFAGVCSSLEMETPEKSSSTSVSG